MRSPRESLDWAALQTCYTDITNSPAIFADIRYGSKNNVLAEDVYGGFQKVLLHHIAAEKFYVAIRLLTSEYPGWKFLIFDALRPRSAQVRFWNLVKGTPQEPYFANPQKGSIHNFGFAIDLSLMDEKGLPLDMGTDFDDLTDLAQPAREAEFLKVGRLSDLHHKNRLVLRSIMQRAGFIQLPHEWWHFDALSAEEVRKNFSILE